MRNIEPKMVAFLDEKLKNNGLAQQAIKNKKPRLLLVQAAAACVGIREKTGNNDGPMVELIQETIGGHSNEPWCAAFVQTMIAYVEYKTGIKSPVFPTELCREMWNETPKDMRVKKIPAMGAIVVFADVGKSTGHVEIVLACDGETTHDIGGNTSGTTDPNSTVNRDGNGVFYTVRSMQGTPSRKILGYLKPFPDVA